MGANIKYKASVFSLLFSDPDLLRELYCALEGVSLPADIPVTINTLQDVLFKDRINDISFAIGSKLVVLLFILHFSFAKSFLKRTRRRY